MNPDVPLIFTLDPPPMVDLRRPIRLPPPQRPVHLPRAVNRLARRLLWLGLAIHVGFIRLFVSLPRSHLGCLLVGINGFVLGQSILLVQRSLPAPKTLQPALLWGARLFAGAATVPLALLFVRLCVEVLWIILSGFLLIMETIVLYFFFKWVAKRLICRLDPAQRAEYLERLEDMERLGSTERCLEYLEHLTSSVQRTRRLQPPNTGNPHPPSSPYSDSTPPPPAVNHGDQD